MGTEYEFCLILFASVLTFLQFGSIRIAFSKFIFDFEFFSYDRIDELLANHLFLVIRWLETEISREGESE